MNGGRQFGIVLETESSNNVVDFGMVPLEDITADNSTPLGYGGFENRPASRIMRQLVTLANTSISSDGPHSYKLINYAIYPKDNGISEIALVDEDGSDIIGTVLLPGISVNIFVKLKLFSQKFQGFIGRWIVFTWEGEMPTSPVSMRIDRFIQGLRTTVCIIPSRNAAKSLSSEARSFIPQSRLNYFDIKVCTHDLLLFD